MNQLLRPLLRRPLHPLIAIALLSVGIATSVATFTYVRAFDRSFPGVDSEGLVRLFDERTEQPFSDLPYLDYVDYLEASTTLQLGAVQRYYAASVRHDESAEAATIEAVAGEYFPVLRARAHIGRLLGPDDDRPESDPAVVISHSWWVTTFGASAEVLGRTLTLNFRPFTIVGVAAPDFYGADADARPQVWMPIAHFRTRYTNWDAMAENRDLALVTVLGRVNDGMTLASAQAELTTLAAGLEDAYPRVREPRRVRVRSATWIDPRARADESATLRLMMIASIGFLLLVCANVANVLLSIAATEEREHAIRRAVGASPWRVVAEGLTRNLVLAGVAGALGLALAFPLTGRLGDYFARPSVWGFNVPRDFPIDGDIVAFTAVLALLTGVVASIPSMRAAWVVSPKRAMMPDGDLAPVGGAGRRRVPFTFRDGMIATQSGLAVTLLILSALLLRTFSTSAQVEPGFETSNLIGALVSVSSLGIERPEARPFFDGLMAELEGQPWVEGVAGGDRLPLSARSSIPVRTSSMSEGQPILFETVRHDFIETLGLPLVDGRDFGAADDRLRDLVLLNQRSAAQLFPEGDAVGSLVFVPEGDGERALEVIGVVGDARLRDLLSDPDPVVFMQFRDEVWPSTNALVIRTNGPATERMITDLRTWLRDYAPHMTVINVVSYEEVVAGALYTYRMNAELFSGVALLGLVLACAGIFSVVSLSVTRRRREIGIRKAMGASRSRIRNRMVVRALVPVVLGGSLGLTASFSGVRLVEGLLYGVSPLDPIAIGAGIAALLLASTLAAIVPASVASRTPARESLVS